MATPNNKKILPDANKFDYMQSAFTHQQINGQIQENPTLNNSSISVPAFAKTAIITSVVTPSETIGTEGMRFVEYRAEEVVQYFDADAGDMSWRKITALTDDIMGPNYGGVWNNSLSEPFSNTFDNLIAFLNVKYRVGDIVTVSYLDNAYQPIVIQDGSPVSKDMGITSNNWGQRWFITGGLPRDGSDTWKYAISEDRTAVEVLSSSGSIVYNSYATLGGIIPADTTTAKGLQVQLFGQSVHMSAGSTNPSFTADATSGEIAICFCIAVRGGTGSVKSIIDFTTAGYPTCFPFPNGDIWSQIDGGMYTQDGYVASRGSNQETSPITSTVYDRGDYDVWMYFPMVQYKAHNSLSAPGTYHIYDITPINKRTLIIDDFFGNIQDVDPGLITGGCGIDVTSNTGTDTTTTITIDLNSAAVAGAGLIESTATGDCAIDVGAGCGIVVNANDIQVDAGDLAGAYLVESPGGGDCAIDIDVIALAAFMAGDCIDEDGDGKLDLALVAGASLTMTGCTINYTGTGTNLTAGCGLEFGTGTATDTLSITPGDLAGPGLRVGVGACDLALGINTLVAGTPDPYADFVAYSDGNVVINHNKVTFSNALHSFNGYTSGNDQFMIHQGGGTVEWVDEGDGIFISATAVQLDVMSCSTVTPTKDDFLAFGNTGVGIANEKASFDSFIKSYSGYSAVATQMLVNTSGTITWETVSTC